MKTIIKFFLTSTFLLLSFFAQASKSGEHLWQHKFDSQLWAPMNLHNEVLYLGSDSGVFYAFDVKQKKIKWTFKSDAMIRSGSVIYGNNIAFASDDGQLYVLNIKDGTLQWRFNLNSKNLKRRLPAVDAPYEYDYLHSSPVYFQGILLIGSADGNLYAINSDKKSLLWKFSSKNKIRATPLIHNNLVYIASWDGNMYALDIMNGKKQWSFNSEGIIQDTPAYGANTLYFGSRSTNFYALNAATGELRWKYHHTDGSWAESTPIFHRGKVYVGSSDALSLYAFDGRTGKKLWQFKNGGWNWATPTLAKDRLYIGAISASPYYFEGVTLRPGFYAVDKDAGKMLWQFTPKKQNSYVTGGVFAPAIVDEGIVYLASINGTLHALQE